MGLKPLRLITAVESLSTNRYSLDWEKSHTNVVMIMQIYNIYPDSYQDIKAFINAID